MFVCFCVWCVFLLNVRFGRTECAVLEMVGFLKLERAHALMLMVSQITVVALCLRPLKCGVVSGQIMLLVELWKTLS